MDRLIDFIIRRGSWILLASFLLAAVGGYGSVQLYRNLRPNLEELLPSEARSVQDLTQISQRVASIDSLTVLVFSDHPRESRRFVDDLAGALQRDARAGLIASVEYRISEEIRFFRKRSMLYVDTADLLRVRDYVERKIEYEREIRNPLNIFSEEEIPEPKLNLQTLRHKYDERLSRFTRFPDGYYATPDEKKRAVLIYVPGKTSDIGLATEVKQFVEGTIQRLNPASYAPDLQIHYTGGVQNILEEHEALVEDLVLSSVIVVVLVTLAMLVFFRTVRGTFALVLSVFIGAAVTFGLGYVLIGYLNANSAFLGSIVIGNGINFGVILLARYVEERSRGKDRFASVGLAWRHTLVPTLTAALAAAFSYGSLILTDFRGFTQFGIIGFIGMVCCWISAYTVLPALLLLLDSSPNRPLTGSDAVRRRPVTSFIAQLVTRRAGLISAVSLILTLASLATFTRFGTEILEADLTRLRSKKSLERGSGYYSKFQDEIFGHYLAPVAILPPSRRAAVTIAKELRDIQKREGESTLIASVQTIDDFIPAEQARKRRLIREIGALLTPQIRARLSTADLKRVREYLVVPPTVTLDSLPPLIQEKFTETNGVRGNLVLVEPPLGDEIRKHDRLLGFVRTLRTTADGVAPGTPVAGVLPMSADTLQSIARDGPRATAFSFAAVVLLVVLLFRSPRIVGSILLALFIGVIWLCGIILGFELKINFLNFVALPITFGIGVDYGVNMFQRYRQDAGGSVEQIIRDTGGAVALASLTTSIGYSSLLLAQSRAFVSFGLLAVLGELTCVTAAIVTLPAYLLVRGRWRRVPPGREASAQEGASRAPEQKEEGPRRAA